MFRAGRLAALVFDRQPERQIEGNLVVLMASAFLEVSLEFRDGTPVYRELARPRSSSFHHPNPAIRVLVFGSLYQGENQ